MLTINNNIPASVVAVIKDGYDKVNALWPISHSVHFINNSGKSRNGYCKKLTKTSYEIAINEDLVKSEDILEVVVHELLHSYPELFDQKNSKGKRNPHGGEWKRRGEIVRQTYGINVSRTNSFERSQTYKKRETKYRFECSCCHHSWDYTKTPKWINHISEAKCPYCHTKTIIQTPVRKTL